MSFADEFHNLVTKLEDEEHTLADKARSLFDRYEKLAEAVAEGVKPLLTDLATQVTADTKGLVDTLTADIAEIKTLLQQQQTPPTAS